MSNSKNQMEMVRKLESDKEKFYSLLDAILDLQDSGFGDGVLSVAQQHANRKINEIDRTVHGLARLWTLKNYRSNLLLTFNRVTNEQFRTKATILPNRC